MKRYCVRCCLFDGLTDSNELFALLSYIKSAGGIGCVWRSGGNTFAKGNIFVDIAAPADFSDRGTIKWAAEYAALMVSNGFNAVHAPCQL